MLTLQIQPDPPKRTTQAPKLDGAHSRYASYEHHELLSLIDDLEDDRSRARVREGIWISLIIHLLFFWSIAYAPHVLFHRPYVVNPITAALKQNKDLTFLNLPPDALKPQKPKPTNIISDKDRVAQTAHPTLDKKTLEELQAMQRAGTPPPPPQPAQQPQQQAQAAQPQQQAQPAPRPLPAAPAPQPSEVAKLDAPALPRPRTHQGQGQQSIPTSNMSVGEMIRQAEQNAARSNGQFGNNGNNAPLAHPGLQSGVEVLSDTMGVDFGPYLRQVIQATQSSWDLLIPESARPPLLNKGKVAIQFMIMPDGSVKQMQLILPSGDVSLDRAAWGGITGASPYPPLPKQFKGPYLALRFYFLYNERPGDN